MHLFHFLKNLSKTFLMPYLIANVMVHALGKIFIQPIIKLWLRKVEGTENIPKYKPFIIASNHSSYYETLLLPSIIIPVVNKTIHAFVNSYYWKPIITRVFLKLWDQIPVYVDKEKDSKEKNKKSMNKAISYLKKNELLMIFPEGKRSSDGKLQKAYHGIARLALKAKTPVLPCGIIGANKVLPKGKTFPRFTRCEVRIGKPMHFEKFYNRKDEKAYEQVTRSIMKEIAKLIGQEYNY